MRRRPAAVSGHPGAQYSLSHSALFWQPAPSAPSVGASVGVAVGLVLGRAVGDTLGELDGARGLQQSHEQHGMYPFQKSW